jgi:serine/threonine protein kinase
VSLPEIIGGKYRPRSVLGSGSTGTVYCVEHAFTGDLLALKLMNAHLSASPDAIVRFKREARTASKIRSPHVVRILDADVAPELGGVPFFVMDLLEGSNLEQLSRGAPVEPAQVVDWLRQIATPLDKAHRAGIIHRDLKPENLFLTTYEDGTAIVKILDFGIARIETGAPGMTQLGQVFGTLLYMAPEQARGDPTQIGPATDLFAMGQIAYQLLAGSEYRTPSGIPQMLHEILTVPLQTPSQKGHTLGEAFDGWFLKACHADPTQRFASAFEQVEALARAFDLPAESQPTGAPTSSGRPYLRDSWSAAPDSPGDAAISLRPADVYVSPPEGTRTPTLPASEREEASRKKAGWAWGFFALSTLAAVTIAVVVFSSGTTPLEAARPRGAAVPVEPEGLAAPGPAVDLPAAAPAAARDPEPPKEPPVVARTPASARDAVRASPVRAAPAIAAPAHKPQDNDPLSDQK